MLPEKLFSSVPLLEVGVAYAKVVIDFPKGIFEYFIKVNVPKWDNRSYLRSCLAVFHSLR